MLSSTSKAILAVSAVFTVLSTAAVALRVKARRVNSLPLKADDFVVCAALIVNIALCASEIYGVAAKVSGRPLSELTLKQQVSFLKLVWASFFVAQFALTLVKISIILFYKRIFATRRFHTAANVMIGIVICWFIGFFFADLFSAWPIEGHWNRKVYHLRFPYDNLLLATAAIAIVLDFTILCMPIPVTLKLHMSLKRKILVIGIFWLGIFCVISSAVRLYYIHVYTSFKGNPNAVFSAQLDEITIWSIIESCMSVITACLPTYGPLLKVLGPFNLLRSIRDIFSTHGRSLLTRSSKSGYNLDETNNGSEGSKVYFTNVVKAEERESHTVAGSSMGERSLELQDIERQER